MANDAQMPERIWAWAEDDDFMRAKPHGVAHGTEYVRRDLCASGQVRALEWVEYDAGHYGWKAPLFGQILVKKHWKGHWVVVWSTPGYTGLFCPGHFVAADEAKAAAEARILAALTPAPQPTDNTALVKARNNGIRTALSILRHGWIEDRDQKEIEDAILAALASHEAPQPEGRVMDGWVDDKTFIEPATPTAQEAVPVGYRVRVRSDDGEKWEYMSTALALDWIERENIEAQPLYAHPRQPSETVAEDDILADAEAAYCADPNKEIFARHCIRAALRGLKGGA